MTLDEAIDRAVKLGEKDPLALARKIIGAHDKHWLAAELTLYAEDIIAEMARHRIRGQTKSTLVALRPGAIKEQGELKIRSFWIPGAGYKKGKDVTSADLRARVKFMTALAGGSLKDALWCQETADLIDAEGVATLGQLQGAVPSLPNGDLWDFAEELREVKALPA